MCNIIILCINLILLCDDFIMMASLNYDVITLLLCVNIIARLRSIGYIISCCAGYDYFDDTDT